jgi:tetratricopeptide (TPR) repeat protein
MQAIAANPDPLTIADHVLRLKKLQQGGKPADALRGAEALLRDHPENRDLLLIAASSLRHLLRIDDALLVLDRLERLEPRFSQLHQERGLCFVAKKDAPRAVESLLTAVNINPALPLAWRMLEGVYRITGDAQSTAMAADHVATLKHLPPDVVTATSLFADGDIDEAEAIIRAFLIQHGNHPDAMRLLARIAMAKDVLDDAETLLAGVVALAPDYVAARFNYAQVLSKRHKYGDARREIGIVLAADPAGMENRALAATIAVGLGEQERAIALYESMLADQPDAPDPHLWMGHALKTKGRMPEAVESYRRAAALRPDFGDAYWSLANLKTYRFMDAEIARMRTEEAAPRTQSLDRIHLCFAIGKALEDKGEFEQSWVFYARGNALKREESAYRPDLLEDNTKRQTETCTRDFFRASAGWGDPRPDPIFIVGLPRSGSTLLEQILASHSQVEGTYELSDIQNAVLELSGRGDDPEAPRYPNLLETLTREDCARLGEKYLSDTRLYRSGRAHFIDKMPNNFRHIGLIHLMLPNAKIIDARREPLGCCFSNFKQLFAQGQEFTYSVDDIARYYRTYLALMRHWDEILPGRVLRVQHEDVVDDLEGNVRRLLDFCGLEFEPACVEFHKNARAVRTASSEQVRMPIFRDGLEQWKNYEPWLGSLKDALGDALVRYRE